MPDQIQQEPVTADDFFDWSEDEMSEEEPDKKKEVNIAVNGATALVFFAIVVFILILMFKGIQWAWNLPTGN